MAEIVLTFITPLIDTAISKAISFYREQISLACGLEKELVDPPRTLTLIQGVLEDAESKQETDQSVALWLQGLRKVAYEAVDLLDEYAYEMLKYDFKGHKMTQEWWIQGRAYSGGHPTLTGKKKKKKLKFFFSFF